MRRIALGLFIVLAGAALLLTTGCQHANALRVVEINGGQPFQSDLMDYGVITDPEGDPEEIEVVPDDFCSIQLQYVEVGLGLPTWTPYQANIKQAQITYEAIPGLGEEPDELPVVVLPMAILVKSDPSGSEIVEGTINILPAWVKENSFDVGDQYILKATVKISGTDDATGEKVEATGVVQISVSDYWDDPNSIGN